MRTKRKCDRQIAVLDTETDPFLKGRVPKPFLVGFYDGQQFTYTGGVAEMLDYLNTQPATVIYAHNGGKFDFHYLISYAPVGTEFFIINGRIVSFKLGKHEFRDSYAILPIPLEQYQKRKIDYAWFEAGEREKHWDEIVSYLESDCRNLHRLVSDFNRDYGNKATMGLTALTVWRRDNTDIKDGVNSSPYFFEKFRPYFFGGRTQAFERGVFTRRTRIYDINSAYAGAMSFAVHPFGAEFRVASGPPANGKFYPHCFYLIEAVSDGCLPLRCGEKLEYPLGNGLFFASGHEIIAGIETNTLAIERVVERLIFRRTVSFKSYIDPLYAIKRSAEPKSTEYIFAKLLMNSLHGKLAANPDKYRHYLSIPANKIRMYIRAGWSYDGLITEETALVCKPLEPREKHYYNLATTASITGWVRALLWRTVCQLRRAGHVVYYCDTDSIITDGELPTSDEIGAWKLEQESDILAVAERKLYAARKRKITKPDEKRWKIASKGVQLTPREIIKVAQGGEVKWTSAAPTFRLGRTPVFVTRTVKRRA